MGRHVDKSLSIYIIYTHAALPQECKRVSAGQVDVRFKVKCPNDITIRNNVFVKVSALR